MIKTDTQQLLRHTFETIMFSSNSEINGWTYNNGLFTCIETGKYLVSYLVIMFSTIEGHEKAQRYYKYNTHTRSVNTQAFQSSSNNQEWNNYFKCRLMKVKYLNYN
jgi:hypothetical protein